MKKIVMLSTGGTIASKRNPETGLLTSGMLTGEELAQECNLPDDIELEVISVFQIPSNSLDFPTLQILKEKIEEVFLDEYVEGIVVTHGTDTLEETAYFLDLTVGDKRPVVVTGSQRSPDQMGTEAFTNLRQAIFLAASGQVNNCGTLVLFNERVFTARHVKKVHSSNVSGFHSPGFGYLGVVDQESVKIYQKPVEQESYALVKSFPEVEIIKSSLGSGAVFMEHAIALGIEGIILEGFGRGHVPPRIMDSVRTAIKNGMKIVITTTSDEGEVKEAYDFPGGVTDLKEAGVILGGDYDSKKARIKLAVLLAAGIEPEDKFYS